MLYYAVKSHRVDVAEWAIKNGASPDGPADLKSGLVPLDRAIRDRDASMVEMLLRYGANPDLPIGTNGSPRKTAESVNDPGIMKLLSQKAKLKVGGEK